MKKSYSYQLLIFITVLWGISFPIMSRTLAYLPPYRFAAIRYLIAAIFMSVFFWKKLKRINYHQIRASLFIGLPFAVAVIGQMVGLNYTSTTNAAFITSLTVILVPVIIWVVEHHIPGKATIAGIFTSLIGAAFMTLDGEMGINKGDWIVFLGTIGFSFQIFNLGKIEDKHDPMILTILQFYIVGLCALPLSFVFENNFVYRFNGKLFMDLLFIIVICTMFALAVQNRVQRYVPSSHVGIIFLLEPVVAMATAFLMGDIISAAQLIGAIIIVISMLIITIPWAEYFKGHSGGNVISGGK